MSLRDGARARRDMLLGMPLVFFANFSTLVLNDMVWFWNSLVMRYRSLVLKALSTIVLSFACVYLS